MEFDKAGLRKRGPSPVFFALVKLAYMFVYLNYIREGRPPSLD